MTVSRREFNGRRIYRPRVRARSSLGVMVEAGRGSPVPRLQDEVPAKALLKSLRDIPRPDDPRTTAAGTTATRRVTGNQRDKPKDGI